MCGTERELVDAAEHDSEPLKPEEADWRGLRMVEGTCEAKEIALDDVERHPDLIEPEGTTVGVEANPSGMPMASRTSDTSTAARDSTRAAESCVESESIAATPGRGGRG